MFDKMAKYTKDFVDNKQLVNDSNLQEVINYLGRASLTNSYLAMFASSVTQFIILGFMAGRETAKQEMAMERMLENER